MTQLVKTNVPQYVSHKRVGALKIASISDADILRLDGTVESGVRLTFADSAFAPMLLDSAYAQRIKPGDDPGYWVRYEDGYESWSPTKAFEEGYTPVSKAAG